jgi:hypothetical protein
MPRLLHISDLHRTPSAELSNTVLLHALKRDLSTGGPPVDIIVASGDIVQGSRDGDAAELSRQYKEASQFLQGLADAFLGGNRDRVVVVPGNHDVDWTASKESMSKVSVAVEARKALLKKLLHARSEHRWSWADFEFYRITDSEAYARRFAAFAAFYSEFYQGKRTFSLDSAQQYDVFDYPDLNMTLVGLNSCHENDHCNFAGRINPDCIANLGTALNVPRHRNRLRIAVWHHNTKGLPQEANYMDARILANLIDLRFVLGLHGHQHRNDIVDEYASLPARRRLTIISAGSLCAGDDEMPSGERRGFNLIDVDAGGNCRLCVRREQTDDPLAPLFGPFRVRGYPTDDVQIALQTFPEDPTMPEAIHEAEREIAASRFEQALKILESLDPKAPMVGRLVLECLIELKRSSDLVDKFYPPSGVLEILALLPALWEIRDLAKLSELLSSPSVAASLDPSIRELRVKYAGLLSGASKRNP